MRSTVAGFAVAAVAVAIAACNPTADAPVRHPDTRLLEPSVRDALAAARARFDAAASGGSAQAIDYQALGEVYLAHHLNDGASDCFDRARALDPKRADAHYLAGVAHGQAGRVAAAQSALEAMLALSPKTPYAAHRLGELHLRAGRVDAARPLVQMAASQLEQDPAVQALAGELALVDGRFEAAVRRYERALKLQPDASRLFYPLARALRGLGRGDHQAVLARAGDGEPRLMDPRMAAVAQQSRSTQMLLEQGQALVAARAYGRAAEAFRQAADQRPDDVFAWASLGRTLELLGRLEPARNALTRAITLDPRSAVAQRFLGMFEERRGNDDAALLAYDAAVRADAEDAAARLLLAHARLRAAQLDDAADQYREVAARRPGNVLARYYLALIELAQGRCDSAGAALTEGLAIKNNYGPLLEAKARHAAVCPADPAALAAALDLAGQLNGARPDAASAVTLALVHAARGDRAAAVEARSLALTRATDEAMRGRLARQIPADGAPADRAWPADSPALSPPRLRQDRLN